MKNTTLRRRYITLIEMMIVMFLIALITGVIAYNYTGSLEKGKAFKTAAGIDKLETILALAAAEMGSIDEVVSNWEIIVKDSPLIKPPAELQMQDGWGQKYTVSKVNDNGQDHIKVYSKTYEEYVNKDINRRR